ncbi:hypothetical protein F383_35277 [Gossypium arboreum]|uniref:Uncharacterized protein n=1 Tax=Gossypium arboreum TaxID=29729 RepID=A0A0B0PTC6_GOSAR|nr:hypothetical protein F383_35277 [Gossypium arboreum]
MILGIYPNMRSAGCMLGIYPNLKSAGFVLEMCFEF